MFRVVKKLILLGVRYLAFICLIGVLTGSLLPTPQCAQVIKDIWPKEIIFPIKETIILKPEITTATLKDKAVKKSNSNLAKPLVMNEDYYWKNKDINVYIDTPDQNYQTMYRYAMKAWNDFGYFHLNEVFHKNKANIICRLENKPDVDWVGRTNYVMNVNTHQLVSATIRLNTDSLKAYEIDKGIRVAIHEFGHAVGLNKHNKDKNSIMYYEEDANQHLTSEDIKRIENLYMQTKEKE